MENPNFPEEILIEIFSRLPAKSVGKCRCLSKSWRTNLSTSQFVNSHLGRQPEQQKDSTILLLLEGCIHTVRAPANDDEDDSFVLSTKLDLPDLSVCGFLGSCNGLVLLLGRNLAEIFVVNPLTRQYLSVQTERLVGDKIYFLHVEYGFGYDRCSDDYKIIKISRFFGDYNPSSPKFEFVDVYSLRKGVWKRLDFDSSYFSDLNVEGSGVWLNGNVHWLARTRTYSECVIATFDLATESFRGSPGPKLRMKDPYRVLAIGGCLHVIDAGDFSDIWIMKEYGSVNSWTYSPITSPLVEYFVHYLLFPIQGKETRALVLTDNWSSLIMWNVTNGTTKDILDQDGATATIDALGGTGTFMESLVSPIQCVVAS